MNGVRSADRGLAALVIDREDHRVVHCVACGRELLGLGLEGRRH